MTMGWTFTFKTWIKPCTSLDGVVNKMHRFPSCKTMQLSTILALGLCKVGAEGWK